MFAKKLLSFVLALAMLFGIVGAVQPYAHALELHEHTDDDCGCPVEETAAVEEVEEPEESETAEEPVETEEPEDTVTEEGTHDIVETPAYDANGDLSNYREETSYPERDYSEYQLTDEQLALPTEELLELVVESWLVQLNVSCCSDSNYEWMYHCTSLQFNGIRELETRPDAGRALVVKLLEYYQKCDPNYGHPVLEVIEMLFEQPIFAEQMTDELYEIVYRATAERYNISIAEVQATYGGPGVCTDAEVQSDNLSVEEASAENVPGEVMPCSDTTTTLTTFGGKKVQATVVDRSTEWTDNEKMAHLIMIRTNYNVEILGDPSKLYNCHSYAWYYTATSNSYWIDAISGFLNDAHSEYIGTSLGKAEPGMIAVYRDSYNVPLHSAIVESVDGDTIICVSKWGKEGLFRHELYEVTDTYRSNGSGSAFNIAFYRYEKVHNYEDKGNDKNGHNKTCTVCKQSFTFPHTYTYSSNGASGHTCTCSVCKYSMTESHTADSLTGKCKYCKYDLSSSPVLPTRKKKLGAVVALADVRTPAPKRPVLSC